MSGDEDLRRLSADLTRAAATAAPRASIVVRKTAFDIKRTSKSIAPVDLGTLKGSIDVSFLSPTSAEIGPTVDYGDYVERGTSRMAPQPYMGPAADKHQPAFEAAMEQLGQEGLLG